MCASVINQINTTQQQRKNIHSDNNINKKIINTNHCDVMNNNNSNTNNCSNNKINKQSNNHKSLANRRQHRCFEFTATTRNAARLKTAMPKSLSTSLLLFIVCCSFAVLFSPISADASANAAGSAHIQDARENISNNGDLNEKAAAAAAAVTPITTSTEPIPTKCSVIIDDTRETREVGAVWISSHDSCTVHACEFDESGVPHEAITKVNCAQFYCDVDSELRPQPGSCCGECVRTKCRFNDTIHNLGQTWHSPDGCIMYECAPLQDALTVTAMINVFEKSCPPLPPDCPRRQVYVKDCCQQCGSSEITLARINEARADEFNDIWTEEFYRNHPCARQCQQNAAPMTCTYTFVVEWYETLSKACYACPHNITDCARPHCILADGIERSVMVVNRMMPGPSLEVCEGDTIVVDVENHLLGDSTTIHWHGMHQVENPYMDGVPHITQCPISPHSTFRYRFRAENAGTHFWHSHTGMQRGDGVFGALIVRRPHNMEPHGHLYDFDLSEHKMILQDWVHEAGVSVFASHHHSRGDNKPVNLLVNGRGRYYYAIWNETKTEAIAKLRSISGRPSSIRGALRPKPMNATTTTSAPVFVVENHTDAPPLDTRTSQIDLLHPINDTIYNLMRLRETNEILRLARVARLNFTLTANNSTASAKTNSTPVHAIHALRTKRAVGKIPLHQMPLQIFTVRRGFRYRFRIINAEFLNCPVALSIDNHTLTAIHSDGYDFEALEVGAIVTYAGERFDFVLNANQSVGNYWIRFKGLMDCGAEFTSAFQVGILHYDGAAVEEPSGYLGWQHKADGIELNAMNIGSGHPNSLTAAEMTALPIYDSMPGVGRVALKPVADYKFFIYYDFYPKDNPDFHLSEYYGFYDSLGRENRVFTPQLNHITLKLPPMALLPDRYEVDDSLFCNETSLAQQGIDCRKEFCKCHHVLQVPLNSTVELILVDEGAAFDANHPFHLHGNAFRVVGLERLGPNVTVEMVKQLDRYNLLKRNLDRPPVKDTVTVPDGGYTIIRFEAYNPGYWLFHCHIEFHAEVGMAVVFKVGDNDEMKPAPKNFPTCHDYMPKDGDELVATSSVPVTNTNSSSTTLSAHSCSLLLAASLLVSWRLRLFSLAA
ncbi:uncharacterized protein Mco1 [Eurosta solidaginis]|uniref:uncharacterized protein Mco1 n=1 Tax=Eurosta solidaginis TaxID=178769 RepID=UPI003531037E